MNKRDNYVVTTEWGNYYVFYDVLPNISQTGDLVLLGTLDRVVLLRQASNWTTCMRLEEFQQMFPEEYIQGLREEVTQNDTLEVIVDDDMAH